MKYFLIFLSIFILAVFQTTVWGFNFLLILVLILTLSSSAALALTMAFLAGLVLDLFSGSRLGFSSLGFLLPSFLLSLYRQRFSFQNPVSGFAFTLISYGLFSLITQRPVNWFEGIFLGVLVAGLRFLAPFLFKTRNQEQLKLEV